MARFETFTGGIPVERIDLHFSTAAIQCVYFRVPGTAQAGQWPYEQSESMISSEFLAALIDEFWNVMKIIIVHMYSKDYREWMGMAAQGTYIMPDAFKRPPPAGKDSPLVMKCSRAVK
jgi:hypothetical protein